MIDLDSPELHADAAPASTAAPLDGVALRWSPVVGRDERPIGFRLDVSGRAPGASLAALLDAALAGFTDEASGMPHGLVLLAPHDCVPDESLGFWGAPRNVLLELDARALEAPAAREHVQLAQKHGVRLALRVTGPAWPAAEWLAPFQYLVSPAAGLPAAGKPPRDIALLAVGVASRAAAQSAFAAGANGVIGWPVEPSAGKDELRPQQRALLNLIRLVQSDADIDDIEKELKRDPMLAYMLLTLANSPAFMRSQPIASLSHAIQLLGYARPVLRGGRVLAARPHHRPLAGAPDRGRAAAG